MPRSASLAPAHPSPQRRRHRAIPVARLIFAAAAVVALAPLAAATARAVGEPVLDAAALLQGHARIGSWMAIRVHIRNDGPAVVGELRLAGGSQGRTQYGTAVDLPTDSDKDFLLYAQPSAFGRTLEVQLASGDATIARQTIAFTVHDNSQLVVGIVAEQPQRIVPQLNLLPGPSGTAAAIVNLTPADLPERIEAWAALDRLVWQDVDTQLTTAQLAALHGWLAAGGRLIIAAGSGGPAVLSGFPDDILPYRPTATVDVPPESLTGLIGQLPADAADIPALGGVLGHGRTLATSGDRVIAAEAPYGSGLVTLLGFDPSTPWIANSRSTESLWRRLLPERSGGPVVGGDDGQMVTAVSQLPELSLPPIGGLIALLFGYILLIGPINYLVLRRLDRREWAWVTMPILIAVFAAGAYGFGAALRGFDVIVNEVAIVRGAPDATEGTAQVYLGVFSPARGTYQVEVPGGALLSSTINGDFTVGGDTAALDVLQGNPARIRNLVVGFGSLRTVRAETAAVVPRIQADLRLVDGAIVGTVRNLSAQLLEKPAIVLGSSVLVLKDLAPGGEQSISLPVRPNQFGDSLSNRILGQLFFRDPALATGAPSGMQRDVVRRSILDQLTYDPSTGTNLSLQSESPVLLAWGTGKVLEVRISGEVPRRTGNVLYYIPLGMKIQGRTTFAGDLIRGSVVAVDGALFNRDANMISFGRGSLTMAYRPIGFDGSLTASRVVMSLTLGGDIVAGELGAVIEPVAPQPCRGAADDAANCAKPAPPPAACDPNTEECGKFSNVPPAIDVFDRRGAGVWVRLPAFVQGRSYELKDPSRYVDPGSGAVLVRFINTFEAGSGFNFQLRIEGDVR